jgi:hypothetical protein
MACLPRWLKRPGVISTSWEVIPGGSVRLARASLVKLGDGRNSSLGLILRGESSASHDGSTRGFQCLSSSLLYRMGTSKKTRLHSCNSMISVTWLSRSWVKWFVEGPLYMNSSVQPNHNQQCDLWNLQYLFSYFQPVEPLSYLIA